MPRCASTHSKTPRSSKATWRMTAAVLSDIRTPDRRTCPASWWAQNHERVVIMIVAVAVIMAVIVGVIVTAAAALVVVSVSMVVGMIVVVRVMMVVIVAAAAAALMVVMVVLVGADEGRREPPLHAQRHLPRGVGVLEHQRHDLGAEAHVVDGAQIVAAQAPLAVEQQKRRRALDAVGLHGPRQAGAVRRVDRDGDGDVLGLEERLEQGRRHVLVVLEHHVQAENRDLVAVEGAREPLRLRERVAQRAGAQHLEGDEHDDLALERLQRERLGRVEPLRDLERRRLLGIEFGRGRGWQRAQARPWGALSRCWVGHAIGIAHLRSLAQVYENFMLAIRRAAGRAERR